MNILRAIVLKGGDIVEVGCGRGDIIGNISYGGKKIGIDLELKNVEAGRFFYKNTTFQEGTFRDVNFGEIECLIMVNFIHGISGEDLRRELQRVLEFNVVQMFVFDVLTDIEGTEYRYTHDGTFLLGGEYGKCHESPSYAAAHGAKRHIEYWRKA